MQEIGNYLERFGPIFGGLFFVLVFGSALALIALATVRLFHLDDNRHHGVP